MSTIFIRQKCRLSYYRRDIDSIYRQTATCYVCIITRHTLQAMGSFYSANSRSNRWTSGQNADHTFRCNSSQFALCTAETYRQLIDVYGIDKMEGYPDV